MKVRLSIGMVTCAIMLAILASVGGVTQARADLAGNPDCNHGNNGYWGSAQPPGYANSGAFGSFSLHWTQHCPSPNSVEVELQVSTDGGNHWSDQNCACAPSGFGDNMDFIFSTDSAHSGVTWARTHQELYAQCSHGEMFRDHLYFANGGESKSTWTDCPN